MPLVSYRTSSSYTIKLPADVELPDEVYDDLILIDGIDTSEIDYGFTQYVTYVVSAEKDSPEFHAQVQACINRYLKQRIT